MLKWGHFAAYVALSWQARGPLANAGARWSNVETTLPIRPYAREPYPWRRSMQRNQLIARRQGRFHLKPLLLAALAFAPAAASAQQDAAAAQLPPLVITADGEKAKFAGILVDRQG